MRTWQEIRDGITVIGGFLGIVAVVALLMIGCGEAETDNDTLDALGVPQGPTTDCSGGDVHVEQGGDGTINATGGDGGDCGNVAEAEEEDEDDVSPAPEFGPGEEVPPFLGSP